jgi:hypothetical protein
MAPAQKGLKNQANRDKSLGGLATKIAAPVDALGSLVASWPLPGQASRHHQR